MSPPDEVGGDSTLGAASTTTTPEPAKDQPHKCKGATSNIARHPRKYHGWRYADSWQAVFRRGWRDALRCAAREIDDADALGVLARMADEYSLTAADE